MSIFKRGSTFWIELRDSDGNRIRESAKTEDEDKALAYEALRRKQLEAGLKKPPTWGDAVQRWMEERSDKRSLDRDVSIARWLAPHWEDKPLTSIDSDEVRRVVELKKKETSPGNGNAYLKFVKALFNRSAEEWNWLGMSPVKMKSYTVPKGKLRFLSETEFSRLMAELPHHLRVMCEFSVLTGLRMSNVTGLRWDRVDMSHKVLWVDGTEYKNKRDHGIPLGDRTLEILAAERGQNEEYVFTYKGYPVQNTNTEAWKKALGRAGIKDFRWHDLRHTFASYHALNGTPMLTLKALGGWQSLAMVDRYAHLAAEGTRQYVDNSMLTPRGKRPVLVPSAQHVGACG